MKKAGPYHRSQTRAHSYVLCLLPCQEAPDPVFLTGFQGKKFYIRVENTSRVLDAEQAVLFVEMNWE